LADLRELRFHAALAVSVFAFAAFARFGFTAFAAGFGALLPFADLAAPGFSTISTLCFACSLKWSRRQPSASLLLRRRGRVLYEHGRASGAMPGQVLRSGQC
jgi:hypothetical protein